MRIVSLLPSSTEILFALGAGDEVVGVSFECDTPPEARTRRVVSTSGLPEGLTPAGIDAAVRAAVAAGEDLYRLDAGALAGLDADLVVTQDLCAVCALEVDTVEDALAHLGCAAAVLTLDPRTLAEVVDSVTALGAAVGRERAAATLVAGLQARLAAVRRAAGGPGPADRPRVLVLEWVDPPYAPGHWIPEMVEAAGGLAVLGRAGERSVPVTWDRLLRTEPDVVVCGPCGFGLEEATAQSGPVAAAFPGVPVWAIDADGYLARPGPRLVDGVEALAGVLAGRATPGVTRRV